MREIVAAQIGTIITNDPREIKKGILKGTVTRLLDKTHMQMMAAFDLGPRWNVLARSPILFLINDETGEVITPQMVIEATEKGEPIAEAEGWAAYLMSKTPPPAWTNSATDAGAG